MPPIHHTWLLVVPAAADNIEDNLNPVGRLYYACSMFLYVPNALSQPGGYALGGQAGEAAIRQVITDAGFTRFRRVAQSRSTWSTRSGRRSFGRRSWPLHDRRRSPWPVAPRRRI